MDEVRQGDTVADVGANIGLYTIALAQRVGSAGRVVAFEPDPANAVLLKRNLALNPTGEKVEVIEAAVGDEEGEVPFEMNGEVQSHVSAHSGDRAKLVRSVTLDKMFENKPLGLLKIDVEGFEEKVLQGGVHLLKDSFRKPRKIFVEVHPYAWASLGTTAESLIGLLTGCGYPRPSGCATGCVGRDHRLPEVTSNLLSRIKRWIVPPGRAPRRIRAGPFRGLTMELDLTSQTQIYLGLFEKEIHPWLEQFSNSIRTAIDIGAGYGEYTLYFLAKTPARKIPAFEPSAESRLDTRSNLKLNGLGQDGRLQISEKFVGSANGPNGCTLDSLAPEILAPCLIKIDVDGGEVDILKGAAQFLRKEDLRWIIETHALQMEEECIRILRQAGFETRVIPNAWWRRFIPEQRPIPHNRWLMAVRGTKI